MHLLTFVGSAAVGIGEIGIGGNVPTTVRLRPEMRSQVQTLIDDIESADGTAPLSENKMMRLEGRLDAREHVALGPHGEVLGYGQAAWHRGDEGEAGHWALEVAVAPAWRDTTVTPDLIEDLRCAGGAAATVLWARAPYVGAAALASGWRVQRTLWEMRRSLPVPARKHPESDVVLATFRVASDEEAWLEANNATFAGHPENGRMTRRDLESRMAQPWFDPAGFFVAWHGTDVVGSCWTKVHSDGVGEIYVIGVVPGWEGRGLGRGLVARGLEHLHQDRHVATAMLFVESTNERATNLYQSLGFVVERTLEAYSYEAAPRDSRR